MRASAIGVAFLFLGACAAPIAEQSETARRGTNGRTGQNVERRAPRERPTTIEDYDLVEGDVLQPKGDATIAANRLDSKPWPKGIIPFVLSSDVPKQELFVSAIAHWESRTPVRFLDRMNEAAYIKVERGSECAATAGYTGKETLVRISDKCSEETLIHELGHVIGLHHEQSRLDRDQYVKVFAENIKPGFEGAFAKIARPSLGNYDVDSVMHHKSETYSANGKPTVTMLDGKLIVESHAGLSQGDIQGVKALYTRPAAPSSVALSWQKKSDAATYSLDVTVADGRFIGPCVSDQTLAKGTSFTFEGKCTSAGVSVPIDDVVEFQICSAENDDWKNATCTAVAYNNEGAVQIRN